MNHMLTSLPGRVRSLISVHYEVDPEHVTDGADLTDDLGGDDLSRLELVMALEEAFGIDLTDDEIEEFRTVADVVRLIEAAFGQRKERAGCASS